MKKAGAPSRPGLAEIFPCVPEPAPRSKAEVRQNTQPLAGENK